MKYYIFPLLIVIPVFIADRAAPGYGKFAFWKSIGAPLAQTVNLPADCSRALTRAEFELLKKKKGATKAELTGMLRGALCETGVVRLDFSSKAVQPEFKNGRFDRLKVISQ